MHVLRCRIFKKNLLLIPGKINKQAHVSLLLISLFDNRGILSCGIIFISNLV